MMFSFSVLRLGLSPDAFWRLSVSEWRALMEKTAPQAMTRDGLRDLMKNYGGENA